ncbi:hypothetical protein [Sorangium sp. So ce131]|uniref:hypothetical protein n=1 Tax=Sorangium sp. So ce131 TaxID=3133282 RepID=UPI003F5E0412
MTSTSASRARRARGVLFAGALAALPARAGAQSASDNETARQLLIDGLDLRDAQQLDAALERLNAAHALVHTPVTGLELGRTYLLMGRLVEACDTFREVVRLPEDRETPRTRAARAEAAKLVEEVAPEIPSLRLRISAPPGSAPQVAVDGESVPAAALSVPRKVNPGRHVVIGKAPGHPARRVEVTVGRREEVEVALALGAPPPGPAAPGATAPGAAAPGAAAPPAAPGPGPGPRSSVGPLVLVGFGVAGAGLAVGGVTGVITLSRASSLKEDCVNNHCPPERFDDLDGARLLGTVSTVSFLVAGVGAAAGVAGLFLSRPEPRATGFIVSPFLAPGSLGVRGTF